MKRNHITSESLRKHNPVTSDSSMKQSHISSGSSRKHNHITSESSSKHSNLTSDSSMKDSEITPESSRKHSHTTSKSSKKCRRSVKDASGKRRHVRHRIRNNHLSSRQPVGCLSSSQNSIVTRSGDLASVQQSPTSSHSRSSEANSANQSSKLPSSSSCSKTSAASGTKMECAMQHYHPLVIDVTNLHKNEGTKTSRVCSVLDAIMDERSECFETVRELDDYIPKVPGRKRRHAGSLSRRTVKTKVSDTLAACLHNQKSSRLEDKSAAHEQKQKRLWHKYTLVHKQKYSQHQDKSGVSEQKQKFLQHKGTTSTCVHKQKCSQHEDDTSSVISLGSDDDEVEIIDSDPKPRSGCSNKTDVDPKLQSGCSSITDAVDTLHRGKPETVIIDLCSPSVNSKYPVVTQKSVDREDKKMSSSKCTRSQRVFKEYVSVLGDGFHASSNRPPDVPSVSSDRGLVPFASRASASLACDSAVNSGVQKTQDCDVIFISGEKGGDKMNSAGACGSGSQKHNHTDVRQKLQAIDNRMDQTIVPSSSAYGSNLYNPHPDTVRTGLRPIVIDGSNVAMGHTNGRIFSCRGLQICIEYFLQRKHKVVAFVPQFRKSIFHSQDTALLDVLEKQGLVTFTPSRKIGKQLVVAYDDRFIVQYAAECGGVIVSTDNYRDLLEENPAWRETIEKRLLMFTWVGDVLMFPQDPLGRNGPNLESFLRFPSDGNPEA